MMHTCLAILPLNLPPDGQLVAPQKEHFLGKYPGHLGEELSQEGVELGAGDVEGGGTATGVEGGHAEVPATVTSGGEGVGGEGEWEGERVRRRDGERREGGKEGMR